MGRAKPDTIRFIDHVHELRKRLVWIALMLVSGSVAGYALLDKLIELLGKPFGHKLYYSAPTGQFSFIIKVCILFGIIISAPAIIYHAARFLEPLFRKKTKLRILRYTVAAVIMAAGGILFAYFLSLPLTLQFLTSEQESTAGIIAPLISADEYFNFVIAYIAGFAVLFQVPLVVLIINSIKPLDPGNFVGSIRYVVLISFVLSAIITPTPDPVNQAIMAGPVIVLYIASYLIILVGRLFSLKKSKQPIAQPIQQTKPIVHQEPSFNNLAPATPVMRSQKSIFLTDFVRPSTNQIGSNKPAQTKPIASAQQVAKPRRSLDGFTPWQSRQAVRPVRKTRPTQDRPKPTPRPAALISDFKLMSS